MITKNCYIEKPTPAFTYTTPDGFYTVYPKESDKISPEDFWVAFYHPNTDDYLEPPPDADDFDDYDDYLEQEEIYEAEYNGEFMIAVEGKLKTCLEYLDKVADVD